jgi:hypothetical protein|tara:strand:- start:17506 stop:18558 length:1053 start_codon:yes stop_codon:yes gene_type:complete
MVNRKISSRRDFMREAALAAGVSLAYFVAGPKLGGAAFETLYDPKKDRKLQGTLDDPFKEQALDDIVEETEPQAPVSRDVNYYAVSANANPVYVNLNLKTLKQRGFSAFIERDEASGLYRTVVASPLPLEQFIKKLKELNRFEVDDVWARYYGAKTSRETLEKRSTQIETEQDQFLDNSTRSQYISSLTSLVRNAQRYNNGQQHSILEPQEILGQIHDAAVEFNVPISEFTAIIYNESNFRNVRGDLYSKNNFSEGVGQMRKTTQQFVFNLMKQTGVSNIPQELPASILPDPELQARMSAFYFALCIKNAGGDVTGGVARYNAGQNSTDPNRGYLASVGSRHKDITKSLN